MPPKAVSAGEEHWLCLPNRHFNDIRSSGSIWEGRKAWQGRDLGQTALSSVGVFSSSLDSLLTICPLPFRRF